MFLFWGVYVVGLRLGREMRFAVVLVSSIVLGLCELGLIIGRMRLRILFFSYVERFVYYVGVCVELE